MPLRDKTTFKIGGRALFFAEPKDTADLRLLLASAKKFKVPIFLMGAGSNILVSDRGVDGLVIQLSSPFFRKRAFYHNYLNAGSGLYLSKLIQLALRRGLSGLEFLVGIPGTLGGALAMNAGAWGRNIADCVEKVRVMDYNGRIKDLERRDLRFGYRKSNLAKYIILSGILRLAKENREEINQRIKRYTMRRFNTQDNSFANAGCVFKNPTTISAGRLIDLCGLKGQRVGGAYISLRHANFILNRAKATATDVMELMALVQKRVKQRFGIILQPEIKIWQ